VATELTTVWGTKPDVTTLLGEDTLTLAYPTLGAGDTVVLVVFGTTAGSTNPTANGLFTGTTWQTGFAGTSRFYYTEPELATGAESGSITITKGSALSRLVGAGMLKFDATMTYDTWRIIAHDIKTNQNGNPASGGSPRSSTLLDDGINDGFTPPDDTEPRETYTVWYWRDAGNSGHPVVSALTGPDTETLLGTVSSKQDEANPNNANTADRHLYVSTQFWAPGDPIDDVVDTLTDSSGFANPNQALISLMGFRFVFENVPDEGGPPPTEVSANVPNAHWRSTQLPYEITRTMLRKGVRR
jgi:hypothetical protein